MGRGSMEGVRFSRAYRFYSTDEPRVTGTVFRPPGGRESWIAIVDDTSIKVLMGGRELAAEEAVRQARLPENERRPQTIGGYF
jgi:hypothetical protein